MADYPQTRSDYLLAASLGPEIHVLFSMLFGSPDVLTPFAAYLLHLQVTCQRVNCREPGGVAPEHAIDRTDSGSARRSIRVCYQPSAKLESEKPQITTTPEDPSRVICAGGVQRMLQQLDKTCLAGLPPAHPPLKSMSAHCTSTVKDQHSDSQDRSSSQGIPSTDHVLSVRAMIQREVVDSHVKLPDGSIPRSATPRNISRHHTRNFIAITPTVCARAPQSEDLPSAPHTGHRNSRQQPQIHETTVSLQPVTCGALWSPVKESRQPWHVWPRRATPTPSEERAAHRPEDGSAMGLVGPAAAVPKWDQGWGSLQRVGSSGNLKVRRDGEEESMSTSTTPFSTIRSQTRVKGIKNAESGAQLASTPRTLAVVSVTQRASRGEDLAAPLPPACPSKRQGAAPWAVAIDPSSASRRVNSEGERTEIQQNTEKRRAGLLGTTFTQLGTLPSSGPLVSVYTLTFAQLHLRLGGLHVRDVATLQDARRQNERQESEQPLVLTGEGVSDNASKQAGMPQVLWRHGSNASAVRRNTSNSSTSSQKAGAFSRSFSALKCLLSARDEPGRNEAANKGLVDDVHNEDGFVYNGDFSTSLSSLKTIIQAEDSISRTTRSSSSSNATPRTISSASATPRPSSLGTHTHRQGQSQHGQAPGTQLTPRVIKTRPPSTAEDVSQHDGYSRSSRSSVPPADAYLAVVTSSSAEGRAADGSGRRNVQSVRPRHYFRSRSAANSKPARDEMMTYLQTQENDVYLC